MNNTTKRSLMTSITALVLCFAMLLGTTFAWFTDEVSSSGNVIKTGNLDIVLKKGAPNENGGWTWTENQGEAIFDYDKWEPGYTTFAALAVENVGSLDAKITAKIVLNGTPTILGEVIDVYTYVGGFDNYDPSVRPDFADGNWQTLGTIADLIGGTGTVLPARTLAHGQRARMIVALHMREDAGNEYQNMDLGANFDIKVLATQAASEFDSFDDQYDADAEWPDDFKFETSTSLDQVEILNNELVNPFIIRYSDSIYAELSAGTKIAAGATEIKFSGRTADGENNLTLGEGESAKDYDIHIEGIAEDNTQPIKVYLGKLLQPGLDKTSLKLYHENDQMTVVDSVADFSINNQFFYDAQTGEVVIYVDNFSVFTVVNTSADKWIDSTVADTSWYDENKTEFVLADVADFLGFRDLVDNGTTFAGKTVKLGADIDLNGKLFNPIGGGWAYLDGKTFNGTFDGQHHTIYNIYINGWELDATDQHSGTSKGAGLFSSVHNATIKNLVVNTAEMVVETTSIGIVAGCAEGVCTFENIVVTNANLGNYQMRNGGIVGDIYITDADAETARIDGKYTHVFKDITVDSTVKLSSMWGDFDTGNGGVVGGRYGDTQILMQNVIVACELDVFSDVTAAYQWYAYRRCGMLVGYTGQNSPKEATTAAADFLTCVKDANGNNTVSVYYGDWVNYTYYQFTNQTDADENRLWNSNYPWVRAEGSDYNGILSNVRYGNPVIKGEKINTIELAEKNYTGKTDIPFNQLYGGGQGVYGMASHDGVTVLANSDYSNTIYFENNAGWEDVYIYYWCTNGTDEWDNLVFPGEEMNLVEGTTNLYTFEIPVFATGVVINNGKPIENNNGHKQTVDIPVNTVDNKVYSIGSATKDEYIHNVHFADYAEGYKTVYFQNNWLWTNVHIESDLGNISGEKIDNDGSYDVYKFEIPNYISSIKFSGTKNDNSGTNSSPNITDIKDGYIYSMYYNNGNKINSYKYVEGYKTIYFLNNWNWSTPTFKYWNDEHNMTYVSQNGTYKLYSFKIPNYASSFIVSGNGETSTSVSASTVTDGGTYSMYYTNNQKQFVECVKLYLKPNSNWKQSNAWFAARIWNNDGDAWFKMNADGSTDYYYCYVPKGYSNVIFCRMNSSTSSTGSDGYIWDNVWNQTNDLTFSASSNCYTIASGAWSKGSGSWSTKE